jgi:signal transduction histidine kinase
MVEDLLDISRAERNDITLQRQQIDLDDAVRRCVSTLNEAGRLQQHSLTIDSEPVWIDADAVRIEQIAVNILGNALKFTPPGGSIHVTVSREGHAAVFRVRDTGVGIDTDLLPRVFDLFVQGERPDREARGLGIGLALVRRMVERHGGTVEASSDGLNHGSTITVRLPVLTVSGAEEHPIARGMAQSVSR